MVHDSQHIDDLTADERTAFSAELFINVFMARTNLRLSRSGTIDYPQAFVLLLNIRLRG